MISNELKNFIIGFFNKKGIPIDKDLLTENTEIYFDLNIHDLDMDLFMSEFLAHFEVDDTCFDRKKYFGLGIPIIDNNVKIIKRFIGEAKWLPLEKEKRKPFTLKILENSLIEKKLI